MVSLFQMLEPACGDMDEQAYAACLDRLLHVLRGNPRRLHEAFSEFLAQELAARVERERVRQLESCQRLEASSPLTCDTCAAEGCPWRGDAYNTNGDCLAEK